MPLDAITLGPFTVDAEGGLSPTTPEHFPSFRVAWRGHVVRARLADSALGLVVTLGRVPSTGRAESPREAPRRAAFATLRTLPDLLPPGWAVALTPDHRIAVEARIPLDLPTTAEILVGEITLFLLRLAPYLDLLAEGVGVEPLADAAVGSVNTCPG